MSDNPKCELCGEPMPDGETMFKYHGHSGPCPKPPLPKATTPSHGMTAENAITPADALEVLRRCIDAGERAQLIPSYETLVVLAAEIERLTRGRDEAWQFSPPSTNRSQLAMSDEPSVVERLRRLGSDLQDEYAWEVCGRGADRIQVLEHALREMIYETTHHSPMELDGSHKCRITAVTLDAARKALNQPEKADDANI